MRHLTLTKLLALCALPALLVWWWSDFPQDLDSLHHHQIADYTNEHPSLLVDVWGRAGFTALHALPAQLGLAFNQLFSLGLAILTCVLVARSLRDLGRSYSALGGAFVFVQTYFFQLSISTMTETVFALFLALGFFFLRRGQRCWAAVAFSYTAATRLEGMPMLLVIAAGLLMQQFRAQPRGPGWPRTVAAIVLLGLFPCLWNIGLSAADGFEYALPLITRNAFVTAESNLYSSGNWYDFLLASPVIFTIPLMIPLVLGFAPAWRAGRKLEVAYFATFFAMQSILWEFGLFRTAGYNRFFASIAPLAAIIAAYGMPQVLSSGWLSRWGFPRVAFGMLLIALPHGIIVTTVTELWNRPQITAQEELIEAARPHLQGDPLVVTNAPWVTYRLGTDPWDSGERIRVRHVSDWLALPPRTPLFYAGDRFSRPDRLLPLYSSPQSPEVQKLISASPAPNRPPWYFHRLKGTKPQFEVLADRSIIELYPFAPASPEQARHPYWARLFRRTATVSSR